MAKYGIPTAKYLTVTPDNIAEGDAFLESLEAPYVLKADGLAAGKGVLIIASIDEARESLRHRHDGYRCARICFDSHSFQPGVGCGFEHGQEVGGAAAADGTPVTAGGRVLTATSYGRNISEAVFRGRPYGRCTRLRAVRRRS